MANFGRRNIMPTATGMNTNITHPGINPPPIAMDAPRPRAIATPAANSDCVRLSAKNPNMIVTRPNMMYQMNWTGRPSPAVAMVFTS